MIACVLALVAAVASFSNASLFPAITYEHEAGDVFFSADVPRVFANVTDRASNHYRTGVHPLFPLVAYPPARVLRGAGFDAIIRRDVVDSVGSFDDSIDCGEDWEFLSRAAARWRFAVVPEDLVFYRWREGSTSSDAGRMCSGLMVVIDRMFERAPPELRPLRARSQVNVHAYVARTYLTRQADRAAVRGAARSLWALLRLQPARLFDPAFHRLCARCLVAWISSPAFANTLARGYHRLRKTPVPECPESPAGSASIVDRLI